MNKRISLRTTTILAIMVLLLAQAAPAIAAPPPGTGKPPAQAKWTFMVYIVGDNNLDDYVPLDIETELALGGDVPVIQRSASRGVYGRDGRTVCFLDVGVGVVRRGAFAPHEPALLAVSEHPLPVLRVAHEPVLQLLDAKLIRTPVELLLGEVSQPLGKAVSLDLGRHPKRTGKKALPVLDLFPQVALEHLDLLFKIHLYPLSEDQMTVV